VGTMIYDRKATLIGNVKRDSTGAELNDPSDQADRP